MEGSGSGSRVGIRLLLSDECRVQNCLLGYNLWCVHSTFADEICRIRRSILCEDGFACLLYIFFLRYRSMRRLDHSGCQDNSTVIRFRDVAQEVDEIAQVKKQRDRRRRSKDKATGGAQSLFRAQRTHAAMAQSLQN